jgi:hypothetical protein
LKMFLNLDFSFSFLMHVQVLDVLQIDISTTTKKTKDKKRHGVNFYEKISNYMISFSFWFWKCFLIWILFKLAIFGKKNISKRCSELYFMHK